MQMLCGPPRSILREKAQLRINNHLITPRENACTKGTERMGGAKYEGCEREAGSRIPKIVVCRANWWRATLRLAMGRENSEAAERRRSGML